MQDKSHFVSVARFATLVDLSERTCWDLIRRGIIPVHRIGRRTLIKPAEGFDGLENSAVRLLDD